MTRKEIKNANSMPMPNLKNPEHSYVHNLLMTKNPMRQPPNNVNWQYNTWMI